MKVELRNIHKRFGAVRANDGVSLFVASGTVHGLLGENGAGKSTLMKVLSGFITPDSGEILLDGKPVRITSPAEAVKLGIGMLHQDPLDFPSLRVLDDFLLGAPSGFVPDREKARRDLIRLAAQFDFALDPDAKVSSLGIGERQQLEIVRLLWLGVRVLILDEPTTAISAQQKAKLFAALRTLVERGESVIFVSHKLEEVADLCMEVTVMASGRVTGQQAMPCPPATLVQMMFGQNVMLSKRATAPVGESALRLDGVTVSDWRMALCDVNLDVKAGEVVGLAGLEGSGQNLVLRACAGLQHADAGHVSVCGADLTGKPYGRFLEAGVSYLPAGRLEEGLVGGMSVVEHVALSERHGGFLVNWRRMAKIAQSRIDEYHIRGRAVSLVEELSGGNQQRTLLALLPPQINLLLMEHPTRGLDIESAEYIWGLLMERTRQKTAIIFASSDLDELLDRSDRILVFFGGRVSPPLNARATTVEQLGELIGGRGFE